MSNQEEEYELNKKTCRQTGGVPILGPRAAALSHITNSRGSMSRVATTNLDLREYGWLGWGDVNLQTIHTKSYIWNRSPKIESSLNTQL